jgi:hypothetical protein
MKRPFGIEAPALTRRAAHDEFPRRHHHHLRAVGAVAELALSLLLGARRRRDDKRGDQAKGQEIRRDQAAEM